MKWNTMAFAPVALAAAGLAHADTYSVSGSITLADPTFNRPVSFSSLSAVGTAVHYDQLVIIGATPGTYDFRMQAVPGGSFDTFLALYAGGFNAAAPLTNLVAFNDDFTNIASGSGFSFDIAAGVTYTVISTAFSNTGTGDYTTTVMTAVPEPATYGLMVLGLFAVAGMARFRG